MKMKQGFVLAMTLCLGTAWSQENPPPSAQPAVPPISNPAPVEDIKPATEPAIKAEAKPAAAESKKANAATANAASAKADPLLSLKPIGTAVVKNENVNIRGQASFKGEVITKLKKGETVTLLEEITLKKPAKDEPANWYRISLPMNTPVWVFADFIDLENKVVSVPKLNVRAGPGENYSIVARMVKGEPIKQLRKVENWVEIEAPSNAFAFVAAEFLEKQTPAPAPEPTPTPEPPVVAPAPAPEVVTVPPTEEVKPATAETPVEAPKPAEPVTTSEPAPAPVSPAPVVEEKPVKRVITREGIVRKARNIQSPTYFQLESVDSGKLINYLHSPEEEQVDPKTRKTRMVPTIDLGEYVGRRVLVTGEELMDKRWKSTPVIEIETIDLQQ